MKSFPKDSLIFLEDGLYLTKVNPDFEHQNKGEGRDEDNNKEPTEKWDPFMILLDVIFVFMTIALA
eukprot:Awhi_evm1s8762